MSIFKNKHLVVATIIAPILALISYFGISALVSEKPHAAVAGHSYQLVEKPNCRHGGGNCGIKNGDFELELSAEWLNEEQLLITLKSTHPLDGVLADMVENDASREAGAEQPVKMRPESADGLNWSLGMTSPNPDSHRLHLVASAGESLYFGDIAMKFIRLENTYE